MSPEPSTSPAAATDPDQDTRRGGAASRPERTWIDSIWVQLGIAFVLSAVIVKWVVPRWRSRALGQETAFADFSTQRPRGLLMLEELLYQMQPEKLGISTWQEGQFADYLLHSKLEEEARRRGGEVERRIRIEVLGSVPGEHAYPAQFGLPAGDAHWLRFSAMQTFRGRAVDVYRLVSPGDLSVSSTRPSFTFTEDYIPIEGYALDPGDVRFVEAGAETLAVGERSLTCHKFRVVLPPKDADEEEFLGHVWLSAEAAPLGVVRIETPKESLALEALGSKGDGAYPDTLAPLLEGRATYSKFCSSCHGATCHESLEKPL